MRRIVRLTERDLTRLVKRVIKEQSTSSTPISKIIEYADNFLLPEFTVGSIKGNGKFYFLKKENEVVDRGETMYLLLEFNIDEFTKKLTSTVTIDSNLYSKTGTFEDYIKMIQEVNNVNTKLGIISKDIKKSLTNYVLQCGFKKTSL
jgi:hypothetical protein